MSLSPITLKNVINTYETLFQDNRHMWLLCSKEGFDLKICRCLDSIQLDLAMLWVSGSRHARYDVNVDCPSPYIANIYLNNCIAKDNKISWCTLSSDLKMVDSLHLDSKSLCNDFDQVILDDNIKLLFVELCLYWINTDITKERNELTKLYLCFCPKAFYSYIKELVTVLTNSKIKATELKKHISLIKVVLEWYFETEEDKADRISRIQAVLFRPLKNGEANICQNVCTIQIDNICNIMNNSYFKPIEKSALCLNSNLFSSLHNIFKIIKDPGTKYDWNEVAEDAKKIHFYLSELINRYQRGGEKKLESGLKSIENLFNN